MKAFQLLKNIFIKNASGVVINPSTKELQESMVSTVNSTQQELAIGATFPGGWEDCLNYSEVIVSMYAVENSATDGLVIQWSSNGVDVHGDDHFTITASSGKTFSFPCQNRYVRVQYTNNGATQTSFDLQTILKRYASKGSSHRLKDNLNMEDDAIVSKSMIAGFTTAGGGGIVNVKVSPSGAIQVGGAVGLTNSSDVIINPATDEKLDEVIAAIEAGGGGGSGGNVGVLDSTDTRVNPATLEKQNELIALTELSTLLKAIYGSLQMPRNADTTNNSDRVTVVNTVATTVSSIATLTTLSNFNGQQAHQMSIASEINAWYNSQRSTIS